MQKRHNYLRIGLLILPLLILGVSFATMALGADTTPAPQNLTEVKELEVEGVTNLGGYTKKVFDIAMGLAGGLAGLAFIIGVVQYMTSAGNPTSAGEGKNKMISALLGLALTLGSLIVLKSISPEFEKLGIKQPLDFKNFTGVYLQKKSTPTTPLSNIAYSNSIPSLPLWPGYTSIQYSCPEGENPASLPFYFFIAYKEENYKGPLFKEILACGKNGWAFDQGMKSYQLIPIRSGIYLFADNNCTDIMSTEPLTSSTNIGPAGSISIVNDASSYYMVSEHQIIKYQGNCTDFYGAPITNPQGTPPCHILGIPTGTTKANPASLTIVRLNTASSAGNGVNFFQGTENKGGSAKIDQSRIEAATKGHQSYKISDVSKITFDYSGINALPEIKNICRNLSSLGEQNCPGSAKVYGDYVIKLKATNTAGAYCKVFSTDSEATNFYLDNETLFGNGNRKLKSVEILQGSR